MHNCFINQRRCWLLRLHGWWRYHTFFPTTSALIQLPTSAGSAAHIQQRLSRPCSTTNAALLCQMWFNSMAMLDKALVIFMTGIFWFSQGPRSDELKQRRDRHKFHIKHLEMAMRAVDNDALGVDQVWYLLFNNSHYCVGLWNVSYFSTVYSSLCFGFAACSSFCLTH